ncbi:MAG: hypothetical protein KAG94_04220 [Clostridiales bacterium]|nr:hypothetical protein [Clostridiales bacterium]
MKKIYIGLSLFALVVLLLYGGALLINNNSSQTSFDNEVKVLIKSIENYQGTESTLTYLTIKDQLNENPKKLKNIEDTINKKFLSFITETIKNGNNNEEALILFREFYHMISNDSLVKCFSLIEDTYILEKCTKDNALFSFSVIEAISQFDLSTSSKQEIILKLYDGRQSYKNAMLYYESKEYQQAIDLFSLVQPKDKTYYEQALQYIDECIILLKEMIINESSTLAKQGFYLDAANYLSDFLSYFSNDQDITSLISYYNILEPELVSYDGPVYHVFFHSLIVYPKLAYDGDYEDKGYYQYMTTVLEFNRMLDAFYANDFILIDINSLINVSKVNKTYEISQRQLLLPKDKKPLIISIDDVSYYNYMSGDGYAEKLVFDEFNEVANLVQTPNKDMIINRTSDVVPILDDFVKLHPDFSFNGAKGIIALTGYEGVFGYETHLTESPNYEQEYNDAKAIADKLLDTGWQFANHSYTHNDYFRDMTVTMENLEYDTNKWELQVEPIIGETHIYISPFGYIFPNDDKRYKYITNEKEYYIYCSVGGNGTTYYNSHSFVMYRINLDGKTLKINSHLTAPFFNAEDIIDDRRPLYIW